LQQQSVTPEPEEPVQKVFVGSIKSNKFHRPDCKWADRIKPANRIWFSSAKHARSKGYEPCKTCKPEAKG
jgi:micrococcal nuclease